MSGGQAANDLQEAVTAHWSARAPLFDGVASHVAKRDVWRSVMEAAFQAPLPREVVDLGCGTGACAIIAASLGHHVRAFDASPEMIASARWAARTQGIDVAFEVALIHEVPLTEASADIVTLRNVLWTLEQPMTALHTAHSLLRPGGRIVVSDGLWSVAPQYRATYEPEIAARLPLHDGITSTQAERMLGEAGFSRQQSWQHLFPTSPYPGDVPVFVLTGIRE